MMNKITDEMVSKAIDAYIEAENTYDSYEPYGPSFREYVVRKILESMLTRESEYSTWEGDVDRQSGAFDDSEIIDDFRRNW